MTIRLFETAPFPEIEDIQSAISNYTLDVVDMFSEDKFWPWNWLTSVIDFGLWEDVFNKLDTLFIKFFTTQSGGKTKIMKDFYTHSPVYTSAFSAYNEACIMVLAQIDLKHSTSARPASRLLYVTYARKINRNVGLPLFTPAFISAAAESLKNSKTGLMEVHTVDISSK